MNANQPIEDNKPLFASLWDQKTIVLSLTALAIAGGAAYTYFVTPVWEAKTTIVFPVRTPSILGGVGMAEQTSIAASLVGGPTPLKIYKGYLESERTLRLVSEGVGSKKRDVMEQRKILDQTMESSLTILARDKDPEKARRVVELHLDALKAINEEISDPILNDDERVLTERLERQRGIVADYEAKLLAFQKSAKTAPTVAVTGSGKESTVVATPARWQEAQRQLEVELASVNGRLGAATRSVNMSARQKGAVPSHLPPIKKWRDRLVDMQYELKIKEINYAPESPEIKNLKEAIEITEKSMAKEINAYSRAISSRALDPTSPDANVPSLLTAKYGTEAQLAAVKRLAAAAPSESIELARLTRDLGTQNVILQQLQAQVEMARIQALRDPNRWQVLDDPEVDDKPVNKSYSKNGAMFGILGLLIGSIAGLIRDAKRSKTKAEPEATAVPFDQAA